MGIQDARVSTAVPFDKSSINMPMIPSVNTVSEYYLSFTISRLRNGINYYINL